jgi:UMF1 family MFS transporter
VITAVFFALAAVPIFLWLQERAQPQRLPVGESYLTIGFKRLWSTFKAARRFREFIKFMLAFVIFNDGIIMALDFAAIIGVVLYGMDQQQLIIFIILVQVTSVVGAFAFGLLADYWSVKRSLMISLLLMIGAVFWLLLNPSQFGFFLIGGLAGFALTGVQSVSRTMVGLLSPPGQSAEFYGLFAVAGRTSSFIGPAVYGIIAAEVAQWFATQGETMIMAEQLGQRWAILSSAVFLGVGLVLLLFVNEKKGYATARLSRGQLSNDDF